MSGVRAGGRGRGPGTARALVAAVVAGLVVGVSAGAGDGVGSAAGPSLAAARPPAGPIAHRGQVEPRPAVAGAALPAPSPMRPDPGPAAAGPVAPVRPDLVPSDPGPSDPGPTDPGPHDAPPAAGPGPLPGAGVPAPGAGYAWPLLPAPAVRTPFRAPEHRFGPGHRGVDLAGAPGRPVLAARAGTVVFAGPVAGRGVVSIQHDDGLRTTYEPVTPLVGAGAVLGAGWVIGTLQPGHRGCPDPACLHWGARRDRLDHVDPLVLLYPPRVRLLPVPLPWPESPPWPESLPWPAGP